MSSVHSSALRCAGFSSGHLSTTLSNDPAGSWSVDGLNECIKSVTRQCFCCWTFPAESLWSLPPCCACWSRNLGLLPCLLNWDALRKREDLLTRMPQGNHLQGKMRQEFRCGFAESKAIPYGPLPDPFLTNAGFGWIFVNACRKDGPGCFSAGTASACVPFGLLFLAAVSNKGWSWEVFVEMEYSSHRTRCSWALACLCCQSN